MLIPQNVIVNADDIGLNPSVNQAILYSYQQGYINSTSLLTNMDYFDEAVDIIHNHPEIVNIGLHGNFAEGKPVTNFKAKQFLTPDGSWDISKTNKVLQVLNAGSKAAFKNELNAQIEKALAAKVNITHIDSHLHLHTLPAFHGLYIEAARKHGLKLRLAQTYREGSYIKFAYRRYLNGKITSAGVAHSAMFETVDKFLENPDRDFVAQPVEIMVHPDFKADGILYDHVDNTSMDKWVAFLKGK
ncbi:MAG: ChbG/HpnK family deacetylase [Bacteroidota bacterium]